jgi:UDP-galactopyranose mutase
MQSPRYLIVGAGFSGAVVARELVTRSECRVTIVEERPHIAGNCHTERDAATNVMVHRYGPHIFNTNRRDVWDYVNRFGTMRPFINRVKAVNRHGIFSLPINLHTINQFFGRQFNPVEAQAFLESIGDTSIGEPRNFEEQALKFLGRDLYLAFFHGYTKKQWGCEPRELPASILKRLPVRFNYDDSYYSSACQGIPEQGYTDIVGRILDHEHITVKLGVKFSPEKRGECDHLFFTGPLDAFFGFKHGRLGYRTVTFERIDTEGDYQGNAVINYTELDVPYTRIHEHKHFAPWETHPRTVAFREFSKETEPADVPYYPKRLAADMGLLEKYRAMAEAETRVSFLGRLATYRYLNMDQVIGEALDFADAFLKAKAEGKPAPVFSCVSV